MDTQTLQDAIPAYFAPWIQEMQMVVETFGESSVTLRLPLSPRLSRTGNQLCGQALMAAADTAMVLTLINYFGELKPCTTVQLNTVFLRPVTDQDCLVTARLIRSGRSLAFGEIDIRGAIDGKSVCRATTTFAMLQEAKPYEAAPKR